MIEFAYNNTKNANTSYTFFELNCGYYLCFFIKKTSIYIQNQELQKKFY